MAKKLKRPRMPKWLYRLMNDHFNKHLRDFLAWFWYCGPKGCDAWNYKLAIRCKCKVRNMQLMLHRLKQLHLITIREGSGPRRVIFANPYFSKQVWLEKSGLVKPKHGAQKIAPITISAQQIPLGVSAAAQPDAETGSKAGKISTRGAAPPLPPAVQGGKARLLTPEELPVREERLVYLERCGLDYSQAYAAVHREWVEAFTPSEIFMIDEMMSMGSDYSDAFDLIMEERNPGTVLWLNHRTKSKP